MLETLGQEHMQLARAKGLSEACGRVDRFQDSIQSEHASRHRHVGSSPADRALSRGDAKRRTLGTVSDVMKPAQVYGR